MVSEVPHHCQQIAVFNRRSSTTVWFSTKHCLTSISWGLSALWLGFIASIFFFKFPAVQGQIQGLPVPSLQIRFTAYCFSCEWLDCVYVPEVGLLWLLCRPKLSFCEVSTALWWFFSPSYRTEPVSATWVRPAVHPRIWFNSSTCCWRFSTLATLFIRGERSDQLRQLSVNIRLIYSFGSIYKMYKGKGSPVWLKGSEVSGHTDVGFTLFRCSNLPVN